MGMFDSVYLKVKCPICGEVKEREGQTKDLECELIVLRKGDNTNHPEISELDCIVGCESLQCRVWEYNEHLKFGWYASTYFYINVQTPLGLVTGNYTQQQTYLS